jgi:EAL domain-containing protein (putative c-di-GMP-specific phosphodiesterase class I)
MSAGHRVRPIGVECLTRGPAGSIFENARALFAESRRRSETVELDRLCLATGLLAAAELGLGRRELELFLNVHASTLEVDRDLPGLLEHHALNAGLAMERMILEIVEAEPMADAAAFQVAIHRLRRRGVRIALDDVGQGHATNRMILAVRPDYIKLDRFLTRGAFYDVGRRALISSYHHMARELGIRVVAEGVESRTQLQALIDIGVGHCQGFLLSEPLTPEELQASDVLDGFRPERTEPPVEGGE